ncbi:immunoglobulin-like domain-containing protein [Faecalitalea cylindroides]|uniref:immunoglobulin-like domain-containing protein n=1 Tax=Faecalitalea cylindroides TaxID=39483 RepID=UPI00195C028B|nr:immunoglobulin-like domain-containing protein [Faecalitalea cylindroides]
MPCNTVYHFTLTPEDGLYLPSIITITKVGQELIEGADYTYNFSTGYVEIDDSVINYPLVLDANAPHEIPPTEVNNLPTIEADDKVLAVDAPLNPLEDVIAYDTEDGTLIEQIIVTNNTADKSQPGKYEVTYQVTDVKGAFTAKTKMDSDTTTIEKDRTDTKKYDVKTNKQKNMVMRIIILAAVITIVFLVLERRNQNNKIARTITCTSFVYISRCFDFKRKLEYSRRAE